MSWTLARLFDHARGKPNPADAQRGWNDEDDGSEIPRGTLASYPAHLVGQYFSGEGQFS